MTFTVWAPRATTVDLVLEGVIHPMERHEGDEWMPQPPVDWRPGLDYGYSIDGARPVPDPRSRHQPGGVHELSRTIDLGDFAWTDTGWAGRALAGAVIYELHVGTFTPEGTLDAAIGKLDHLVDLGVTFVELLPVNAVNGTHNWGYDGVLWFAVHEPSGGPEGYRRFVDACHARGLAVVQDVVYNHLGPSGNWLPLFGPYLGEKGTSWGEAVNLDGEHSAGVRRYILDNAAMWFREYHVDALRLDAVHALHDSSTPHLLAELSALTDALALELGRPLTLIAESDLNDPVMITPRALGGRGMTAQWSDDFHHAAHVALTEETFGYYADFASLGALAKVLSGGFFHDGTLSTFRGRPHGAPIDTAAVPAWRLVTFTQNHDQIGNRAAGDRPSQYLDVRSLEIEAVLALLTPFTPMLFMGQEWGATTPWPFFTSHPEPELGRAVAEGRLAEFAQMGWEPDLVVDPQDPATVESARLDWSESERGHHARLLDLYRRLTGLRRQHPEFTDPAFVTGCVVDEGEKWLAFDRGSITVAINFDTESHWMPVTGATALLTTRPLEGATGDALLVPARGAAVVQREG